MRCANRRTVSVMSQTSSPGPEATDHLPGPAAATISDPLAIDDDLESIEDAPVLQGRQPHDEEAANRALITATRRSLTPIRGGAVQLPRETQGSRMGSLLKLASAKQHVAFDLALAMLTLEPVTRDGDFLDNSVYARFISTPTRYRAAPAVSRGWAALEELAVIDRPKPSRRAVLMREDGTGVAWTHPGVDQDKIGYFSLPRAYWTKGHHGRLSLAGKAMLMIILSATNEPGTLTVSHTHDKFAKYYGLSAAMVKRGLQDLRDHHLLNEQTDHLRTGGRSKTGYRSVTHYWLRGAFSNAGREKARALDAAERTRRGVAAVQTRANLTTTPGGKA